MLNKENIISKYSSKQAIDDGFLFDIIQINKDWEKGIFNYITNNLMSKGYLENGKVNIPNVLDLLNQCNQIVKVKSNNFKEFDNFFSGEIEIPNGTKEKIFISQNETDKFTIMLPSDY